jgi:hypothetical protein
MYDRDMDTDQDDRPTDEWAATYYPIYDTLRADGASKADASAAAGLAASRAWVAARTN